MKKILVFLLSSILLLTSFTYATDSEGYKVEEKINSGNSELKEVKKNQRYVTREEIFVELFSQLDVRKSYKYINLYYTDVDKGTPLYTALQKGVYLDLFVNTTIKISPQERMSQYHFMVIAENILNKDYGTNEELKKLKGKYVTEEILENLLEFIKREKKLSSKEEKRMDMLVDIYTTIIEEYYYRGDVDKDEAVYAAIAGMLTKLDDRFTKFFPPELSKKFLTHVNASYEGIGIYSEMDKNNNFVVLDVIPNSPADREGLKKNDIIRKVDGKAINGLTNEEILELIKGEIGISVKLEIMRGIDAFNVIVMREEIIIPTVTGKFMQGNTYYIDIDSFSKNTYNEFKDQLKILEDKKNVKKIILDFRDNPGGYLDQATRMLDTIIPEGEDILVIKYQTGEIKVQSKGTGLLDIDKYEVCILVNKGSASASEVMVGVMKDYFPNIKIFGKTTYGKGSVQSFKTYEDGSSFKYTVAKWLIGKNRIGIDKIGISPDIEVELNEKLLEKEIDTQLNAVLDF